MPRRPAPHDYSGWVAQLAVTSRRQEAKEHLLQAGPAALPAIRRGVHSPKPVVRRLCVGLLDFLVDEDSLPELIAALDDEDAEVCKRALHALACDRCKQNECRPGEQLFVPRVLEFLRSHPNPDVRAGAIDTLGKVTPTRAVIDALEAASQHDPDRGLRGMATWHLQKARKRAALAGASPR